ncbi:MULTISPECIES: globin domain-containing protein [Leisingera]|uniref:globin domain-containing protein n=1 Tax=Leisingera TaxID=191028 RepID=UPI00041DBD05|nr:MULTISPECIES: globin domain-containing protein [Leisingera]
MECRDYDVVNGSAGLLFSQRVELAEQFYTHLFEALPQVKPLFKSNFSKQKEMFTVMLAACVRSLSNERELQKMCEGLRAAHASYNLSEIEIEITSQSLLKALKEVLGDSFDTELQQAWERTIVRLMRAMV